MQTVWFRSLVLAGLFALAAWLVALMQVGPDLGPVSHWPSEDALYAVDGWHTGPPVTEATNGNQYVTRTYVRDDGTTATLALTTSPNGRNIYRAEPGVPFLGNGYTVEPAPSFVPQALGRGALVGKRGDSVWLQIHAYGERRGQLGNGARAWSLLGYDLLLRQPNDYYIVRLQVPFRAQDEPTALAAASLADTLFARVATWYGA